jgi:hypothetical protein
MRRIISGERLEIIFDTLYDEPLRFEEIYGGGEEVDEIEAGLQTLVSWEGASLWFGLLSSAEKGVEGREA